MNELTLESNHIHRGEAQSERESESEREKMNGRESIRRFRPRNSFSESNFPILLYQFSNSE